MNRNYRESIANILMKERKVTIVSEVPKRITCTICGEVIVDARQSFCGCRYCCQCITDYLKDGHNFCPGSSIECHDEELILTQNVIPDFGTDQEIRRLHFRCINNGCSFEDQIRLMDEHLQTCLYGEECCELCGVKFLRMNMECHRMQECENRLVKCEYCGKDISAKEMLLEHKNIKSDKICHMYQCICPLNCGIFEPIILEKHRLVCANRPRKCPYVMVGCPAKGFTKKDLNNHIKEHIFDHSRILFDALQQYKEEVSILKNKLKHIEDNFLSFVWKLDGFLGEKKRSDFYSPKFSLGTFSYQAMMKLAIVDDYIQVYFIIVKGEYDDILQWPFDNNVTISILDQTGQDNHYAKTMRSPLDPERFKKPNENAKGYGWDKFIAINTLRGAQNFLRNERLFIKCTVSTAT